MDKLRNLSLKKTIILYLLTSLLISFLLSAFLIQIATNIQQQITWKYVDETAYLQEMNIENQNYELPMPKVKADRLNTTDRYLYEICDFLDTYIILIFSVCGSGLAVAFFYRNKLKPPIEELSKAADLVSKEKLDFHVVYENKDELGQLCKEFENMRKQLEENNRAVWHMMEEEKALRAAIAHELLHTKPISAWQYILGKVGSGYIILMVVLAVLTIVFGGLCIANGVTQGFSVNPLDFVIADVLYIMPNMLMIVCVYAIAALIFKNPLPATPLLFLYIIYSNMGGTAANGQYGYQGRLLSIIVRFPGRFFDTEMPPMLLLNQTFLILASVSIICIAIYVWNRRRVY